LSMKGVEHGWKKMHVIVIVPRGANISHNSNKNVVKYIMGSYAFVTMGAM
jgi:hypothetical protein